MSILPTIVSNGLTAVIAAWVGSWLALRKYRSERLWDRKLEAYVDLLESLFHIRYYTSRMVSALERGAPLTSDHIKRLGDKASAGYEAVRKAAAVGIVLLGPEAAERLERLEEEWDGAEHPDADIYAEVSTDLRLAEAAIDDLRTLAARDLKIPDS